MFRKVPNFSPSHSSSVSSLQRSSSAQSLSLLRVVYRTHSSDPVEISSSSHALASVEEQKTQKENHALKKELRLARTLLLELQGRYFPPDSPEYISCPATLFNAVNNQLQELYKDIYQEYQIVVEDIFNELQQVNKDLYFHVKAFDIGLQQIPIAALQEKKVALIKALQELREMKKEDMHDQEILKHFRKP